MLLTQWAGLRRLHHHQFLCRLSRQRFVTEISAATPPDEFYEHLGQERRIYFYRIDTRGNLYLEQTLNQVAAKLAAKTKGQSGSTGRNIANALKDPKFLRFFYTMLRVNSDERLAALPDESICGVDIRKYCAQYAYVSLCGKELNFVRPDDAASALGFSELKIMQQGAEDEEGQKGARGFELSYGGAADLREPFDPSELSCSTSTQRLYHPLASHGRLRGQLGLLHPHLAGALTTDAQEGPDGRLLLSFEEQVYAVKTID